MYKYVVFNDPVRVNDIVQFVNDLMTGNLSNMQDNHISKEKNEFSYRIQTFQTRAIKIIRCQECLGD